MNTNYIEKVSEFHRTFEQPILETPQIPLRERIELRIALLEEELKELKEGIENRNLVEVADALCDLQYVLTGTILELGYKDIFDKCFEEVHRSNMSKACKTRQEAMDTLRQPGFSGTWTVRGDGPYVVKRHDGKVIKSINYSPANLLDIVVKKRDSLDYRV